MTDWQLRTPVAFLIFNRPETTLRVFEEIRRARPPRLLVVADGPRSGQPRDNELCSLTRGIIDRVDWPCELLLNLSEQNLGCMRRISSGLDWVFDNAEEAIILEDDCLPDPTFFRFCEELLVRYRHDDRIAQIGGVNYQPFVRSFAHSYYFSRYNHIWGWASWRRSWITNDNEMRLWPEFREGNWLYSVFGSRKEASYWENLLNKVAEGEIDTWDSRWALSCWRENRLTVLPAVNLVSNIGFGPEATHTREKSRFSDMPHHAMEFPLMHPRIFLPDRKADEHTASIMFRDLGFMSRVRSFFTWG